MKISVYFVPAGVVSADIAGRPVIVVDILRATSTIVAAMASGARAVVPTIESDEAIRIAQNLERGTALLAGERGGERISGFALGNSPGEMTPEAVGGKIVVMSTTNGTPAIRAADGGGPVLIGAATNFRAVVGRARELVGDDGAIAILCAGRERGFALEDAYAAGRFAQALIPPGGRSGVELNDAAIAALELIKRYGDKWKHAVAASTAARELTAKGFKDDVVAVTEVDRHDVVPVYADRQVTLAVKREM
jgi:2-phosphosulfolactate phosphatase